MIRKGSTQETGRFRDQPRAVQAEFVRAHVQYAELNEQ